MVDIDVKDELGLSVPGVNTPDSAAPSSLLKYAQSQFLHLIVAHDLKERASQRLSTAAPGPVSFDLKVANEFQLGRSASAISFTPSFQGHIRANTADGATLFKDDSFPITATVPDLTGYVAVAFAGSLDVGISGSSGDFTFGFDAKRSVALEYWRAFPLGTAEPTFGEAISQTLSHFVIPAELDDLRHLDLHDVCVVSGEGSLKVSGAFSVSAAPNPLASIDLPVKDGRIELKTGVVAGLSGSFTITGAYQIRARRTSADSVELSFHRQHGRTLLTDLTASAGVTAETFDTDLLARLLGAISSDPNDAGTLKLLAGGGLSPDEIATLTGAIKDGLDHSLAASLDLALSESTDQQAAFQYEIRPAELDPAAMHAVNLALQGDLSALTNLETSTETAQLAPGLKLISSVLTRVRAGRTSFKVNLLGLVNFSSVSELIRNSVVVKDPGTGSLTITDTATGNRINAEVDPMRHSEALHRAMFESMVLTAAYRVSKVVDMTGLSGHLFHFHLEAKTKPANYAEYLRWFAAMGLLTREETIEFAQTLWSTGPSTCLLRADFDEQACHSLFFDEQGRLWERDHYLQLGRQALQVTFDASASRANQYRELILTRHWAEASQMGPSPQLAQLVGLHPTDSGDSAIIPLLIGDVATVNWWATAMTGAGHAVAEAASVESGSPFQNKREKLHRTIGDVIRKSGARFDQPWGLLALFWAAGSRGGSGRIQSDGNLLQRPVPAYT